MPARLLNKDEVLSRLMRTFREKGYDGVLAIRISHPVITNGAIEVVVTGTGYWRA